MGAMPDSASSSLVLENGFEPKKPLCAERPLGCALFRMWCLPALMSLACDCSTAVGFCSLCPHQSLIHMHTFRVNTAARQPVTPGNAQCRRQRQGTLARAHLVLRGGPPQNEHDALAPLRYAGDGLVREALPALRRICNLPPSSYVVGQRCCATGFGAQDCGASKRRDSSQGT